MNKAHSHNLAVVCGGSGGGMAPWTLCFGLWNTYSSRSSSRGHPALAGLQDGLVGGGCWVGLPVQGWSKPPGARLRGEAGLSRSAPSPSPWPPGSPQCPIHPRREGGGWGSGSPWKQREGGRDGGREGGREKGRKPAKLFSEDKWSGAVTGVLGEATAFPGRGPAHLARPSSHGHTRCSRSFY